MTDISHERPDGSPPSVDHTASSDAPRLPRLLTFDVNETLSDLAPMARGFEDVGAPDHLATSWFAGLLRDGFALTVVDSSVAFAHVATEAAGNQRPRPTRSPCSSVASPRRTRWSWQLTLGTSTGRLVRASPPRG